MTDSESILRQFNEQSNNKLATENMNYLESLYSAVSKSIKQLSSFNVNTPKFIQIKSLHGAEFNTSEFNETIKDTTINFLKTILGIIDSLKKKLVQTKSDSVRDEYRKFHNNIINKIKDFINYYLGYVIIHEQIRSNVYKKYREGIDAINILIQNNNSRLYNISLDYRIREDPNFHSRHSRQKTQNDLLEDYFHYLDNDIQIFNSLRESFKNMNTSFLRML
jgi:hypothetical protein